MKRKDIITAAGITIAVAGAVVSLVTGQDLSDEHHAAGGLLLVGFLVFMIGWMM